MDKIQEDWTLSIKDIFDHVKVIKNPKYIPRINERVYMGYMPAPIVTNIVYNYEGQIIIVDCG